MQFRIDSKTVAVPVSIAAVGDLSFAGALADAPSSRVFAKLASRFSRADLAVANLESPLVARGRPIPGKAALRASPDWAKVLRDAGIRLVSLANNHVMDFGPSGLIQTMDGLDRSGVQFVGAGLDGEGARAAVFLTVRGTRLAFLARTGVIVNAPTCAGDRSPGTAWLDPAETAAAITRCREHADVVVLLLHWGLEEYRYPSPRQRELARRFVEAGANLILGHHPHVTQGVERMGTSVVAYSLGNFTFGEFEWAWRGRDGSTCTERVTLSPVNRQGAIAEVKLEEGRPPVLEMHPTCIDPDGSVRPEDRTHRVREQNRLGVAFTRPGYRVRWRLYALNREWILRLKPRNVSAGRLLRGLLRIRLRHLTYVATSITRSSRVVLERSTNPYE